MSSVKRLDIYRGADLVGSLYDEQPMRFVYDDNWRHHHKEAISPNISLSQAEHSGQAVEAYFENLLPEAMLVLIDQVAHDLNQVAAVGTEKTMVERLHQYITGNTKGFQKRIFSE